MKPLIEFFQDDLTKLLEKYCDEGLTFGGILGTIEIVKLNFWNEQSDDEETETL